MVIVFGLAVILIFAVLAILVEPDREAWDVASFPRGGGKTSVPAWTESERLAWAELPPAN